MADNRLQLEAGFKDNASAGVKKLGKALEAIRPTNGMAAANKWMGEFRAAADKAERATQPISTGLNALGVGGLAASLSMGELVKQFKDLADSTLTMRELGRQARMSATEIARLQYAAGKLHVDPAAMNGAIDSWSDKMVEFRRHTGRFYTELMRQNSDVARKIAADSPVEGLKDTLAFLSRIKDPQIQKRWAEEAGVGSLVPMLGKGPEGLASAFADAANEVKPITEAMQQAADRFNEATNRFNQAWTNLKNDIGPQVLDPLSHTVDKLDEALKFAAAYPGDAAAAAATIAGAFAAFWLRARIMRGSMLAGGGAAAGRELSIAAAKQGSAGTSLMEAAVALKEAAAELSGKGLGGGSGPGEPEKAGGGPRRRTPGDFRSPGYNNLGWRFGLAGFNMFDLAFGMPDALEKAKTDNAPMDAQVGREADWGDTLRHALGIGSQPWHSPSRYSTEARARRYGLSTAPTSTLSPEDYWARKRAYLSGRSSFHPDDDRLSRARSDDFKKDVKDGSKEGIIAGLRELAQQQELGGGFGDGGTGASNFRYGRNPLTGGFRHTPSGGRGGGGPAGPLHFAGFGNGGWEKAGASKEEVAAYIRQAAAREGIDPETAVRVARSEGLGTYRGDYGTSFGPFQLHYGGSGIRGMNSGGLGDTFTRETGLDARDPKTWKAQVDYAMKQARRGGWTPWHGAARVGIGPRQGIGVRPIAPVSATPPAGHAAGGLIRGPGSGTSDSILARLSNEEFVVNARASRQWLPLLHAINAGRLPGFASGGQVGFGVAKRFYPTSTPGILPAQGQANRRSWLDFFRRPRAQGGMGAPWHVALGATAMMNGETGWGLNSSTYNWDANGPSGGAAQWHDVTMGRGAGRLRRLSDLMALAMLQHEDWHSTPLQQAWWKHEADGDLKFAWAAMRRAKTAAGTLSAGVHKFEVPANANGEVLRRLPNIVRLAREAAGGAGRPVIDPVQIDIRHHPHTGKPVVTARGGKGTHLGIRTGPTMRPT